MGKLLVTTPYGNTRGVFVDCGEHSGFPAYQRQPQQKPFLYKMFGEHWAIGDELGTPQAYHCCENSNASKPEEAAWDDITVGPVKEVDTADCPKQVVFKTAYSNTSGGYVRVEDYEGYPAYANEDQGVYCWHCLANNTWYLADGVGSCAAYNTTVSGEHMIDKVTGWQGTVTITPITWEANAPDPPNLWRDPDFPPDVSSLGVNKKCEWVRCSDIDRAAPCEVLFDEVHPNDCLQGGVGNCWLIAGIASVAEFPSVIEDLFEEKAVSPDGKYHIKLYDMRDRQWHTMCVDSLIPCEPREYWTRVATPLFSKLNGKELWVALLEKAFAKFVGSYQNLSGGQASWAWQALTGVEEQQWFIKQGDGSAPPWQKCQVKPDKQREHMKSNRRACPFYPTGETLSTQELFETLAKWDKDNYMMSASVAASTGTIEHKRQDGLVEGHAYSVLKVVHVPGCNPERMICLRNPWGGTEWNGAWSDKDPQWNSQPKLKQGCGFNPNGDDGRFWMCFADFTINFSNVFASASAMKTTRGGHSRSKAQGKLDAWLEDPCFEAPTVHGAAPTPGKNQAILGPQNNAAPPGSGGGGQAPKTAGGAPVSGDLDVFIKEQRQEQQNQQRLLLELQRQQGEQQKMMTEMKDMMKLLMDQQKAIQAQLLDAKK